MPTDAEVKARIEARRWAEECYEAADNKAAFAERINQLHNPPKPSLPISDAEMQTLSNLRMPWGKHTNEPLHKIPLGYLIWISEADNDGTDRIKARIRRYLSHHTIQATIQHDNRILETDNDQKEDHPLPPAKNKRRQLRSVLRENAGNATRSDTD